MFKKLLLSFFSIFIIFSSVFPAVSYAQTSPWYAPSLQDFNDKVQNAPDSEIFGERYTQAQIYWIVYSLVNLAIGQGVTGCTKDPAQVVTCIQNIFSSSAIIPGTGDASMDPGMILPLASLVDQAIRYRPASGVSYVAEKLNRLNVIDNAYAQDTGFGYTTLSPASPLWRAVRNASYALMVVVIIVLAFMIMFRTRISPQASLTIQIAIPRIVIALVLITFSFAIAGFLIDLAYLVLGLVGAMFSLGGISTLDAPAMFGGFQHWGNGMVSIGAMLIIYLLVPTVIFFVIPPTSVFAVIGGIIVLILLIIIYLIILIKILWLMFRSMLTITLLIVFSPIYILWGVVSSGGGYGQWLKSFVGHLSIFVTIPLFIFFANVIMWGSVPGATGSGDILAGSPFLNPFGVQTGLLAGGVELPGFFGGFNPLVGLVGALILLLSASKMASSIRDLIITGRAQFGADLSTIGGAAGVVGFGVQGPIDQIIAARKAQEKFAGGTAAARRAITSQQRWERGKGFIQGVGRTFRG